MENIDSGWQRKEWNVDNRRGKGYGLEGFWSSGMRDC